MRSLCNSFAPVIVSLGIYASSIPDNLNEGHLGWFFWLIARISFVNLIVCIGCAVRCRFKKDSQSYFRRVLKSNVTLVTYSSNAMLFVSCLVCLWP
jgi:phosphoglycerol transferase MdoB-like AlkP superfamily enzyme